MPAGKESDSANSSNPAVRTSFRPPWVKEGPNPLPTPATPWAPNKTNRRDSNTSTENSGSDYNPLAGVQLRKTSVQKKEPQENGEKESFFKKPQLKHVPQKEKSPPKKDHKIYNLPTLSKASERVLKDLPKRSSTYRDESSEEETETETEEEDEIDKEVPAKRCALVRDASMRRLSQTNIPPPPPPIPGMPPPPPMMPGELPKKLLNDKQKSKLEKLKRRTKNRPDWSNLLQEIEAKKTLKHVVCNDRSSPLLPEAKHEENFLYKSEEANVHNELLKQIEGGIKLKKVKTNDRSKPMLDGLRKFRRQMTIEEQIQKSISMASIPPEEITDEIDEMDDIDKVRDDLQSTKQMLALELRNKEAQERENKRLLARIQNLEAELEKAKSQSKDSGSGGGGGGGDDKLTKSLKKEVEEARKSSQDVEKKYKQAAEDLDSAKSQLDDMKRANQLLEKRLQEIMQGKRLSFSDRKLSTANASDEEEEIEEESDGEDTPEKREKRLQKEVKQLTKKLQSCKTKEDNAKKERVALREIIKNHQTAMKEEKKKYKQLKKEVDKMAALMKDVDADDEEDEEAEDKDIEEEETEEEEESTEEEDSESDDDDDDSGSERSQSEDEDAPPDKKKVNLSSRVKRHENILNALKKGNFLLKTNAERLQDDLNKQKEMTAGLQEDLDSVLSELG